MGLYFFYQRHLPGLMVTL